MLDLSSRQLQIMKAVIEEFIGSGNPVGSETLDKKYSLGISPATIRNEMSFLTKNGLLVQPHTSAGRIPSRLALRLYIKDLMEEKELSVAEEVSVKERVWDLRHQASRLLKETSKVLAEKSHALAVVITEDGELFHAGYANILELPEFYNIKVTRSLLSLLDNFDQVLSFFKKDYTEELVHVLMGDEFGIENLNPVGMVYTHFHIDDEVKGSLGVFGPSRLDYSTIIPLVRYFGKLIDDLSCR